jgi:hypothetical protein
VGIRPIVLLTPSRAAAVELPRRLASTGRALSGLYSFKPLDLARAIAEPALLGRGLRAWDTGHDALLAARLLEETPHGLPLGAELPRGPVAAMLALTLSALRRAGVDPATLEGLRVEGDEQRLAALGRLYRAFHQTVEGHFADPATVLREARRHLAEADWLKEAEVVVVEDLELDPLEKEFVEALAGAVSVRMLAKERPSALVSSSFGGWARAHGLPETAWSETALAPIAPPVVPAGLARLRQRLLRLRESRRRCGPSCVACSARPCAACLSRRWA